MRGNFQHGRQGTLQLDCRNFPTYVVPHQILSTADWCVEAVLSILFYVNQREWIQQSYCFVRDGGGYLFVSATKSISIHRNDPNCEPVQFIFQWMCNAEQDAGLFWMSLHFPLCFFVHHIKPAWHLLSLPGAQSNSRCHKRAGVYELKSTTNCFLKLLSV